MRSGVTIRVLVIDDCPLKRRGIIAELEEDPAIEVLGEADGLPSALALASEVGPAVAVVEPAAMCVRGRSTMRRLVTAMPESAVLALSAGGRGDDVVDAVAAGVRGYLGRGTSGEVLRDAVRRTHAGAAVIDPRLAPRLMTRYARHVRREEDDADVSLTEREQDVLRLMLHGHTQEEIGAKLKIAPRTVQFTAARIRRKTGLRRRSDLVRWAAQHISA